MGDRHANRLFRHLISGATLNDSERRHAAQCDACRKAIADADRLDERLAATAHELSSQPLPPDIFGLTNTPSRPFSVRWLPSFVAIIGLALIVGVGYGSLRVLLGVGGPGGASERPEAVIVTRWLSTVTSGGADAGWDLLGPDIQEDVYHGDQQEYVDHARAADWTHFKWTLSQGYWHDGPFYKVYLDVEDPRTIPEFLLEDDIAHLDKLQDSDTGAITITGVSFTIKATSDGLRIIRVLKND